MSASFSWSKASDTHGTATAPSVDAKQSVPVMDQLQRVYDAWNPQSPNCAFQYYFYNTVTPEQAQQYVMPPGQDPQKWERAMLSRPDSNSIPVLAIGFTDLEKRISLQASQVNAYRVRMHEINDKLVELSNRHDLHTTVKLLEMRERHMKLARRVLDLAVTTQVRSNDGKPLNSKEELFKSKALTQMKKIDDPSVYGSLSEAWARVSRLKEQKSTREGSNGLSQPSETAALNWEDNQEQLELIVKVLAAQQKGITLLAQVVQDDTQKLDEELGLVTRKPKQLMDGAINVAPQAFATQVPQNQTQSTQSQKRIQPLSFQNQNTQQQQPQPGLFGKPISSSSASGTGLFGGSATSSGSTAVTNTSVNASSGLFGTSNSANNNTASTSGGLFGNSSSGLFSDKKTTPGTTAGSGLFGNSQTNSAINSNGGIFGNAANINANANTNTNTNTNINGNTGLFGNNNTTSTTNTAVNGNGPSLFGGASSAAPGLFGATSNAPSATSTTATSGSLFGANNNTTNSNGGLFGANVNSANTGLFGQNKPGGISATPAGNIFGGSNSTAPAPFGQNSTMTPNTASAGGLFGAKPASMSTSGTFGQPAPSSFGTGFTFGK